MVDEAEDHELLEECEQSDGKVHGCWGRWEEAVDPCEFYSTDGQHPKPADGAAGVETQVPENFLH